MSMKGIIVDRISEFSSRKKGVVILVVLAGLTTYLVCKKVKRRRLNRHTKKDSKMDYTRGFDYLVK